MRIRRFMMRQDLEDGNKTYKIKFEKQQYFFISTSGIMTLVFDWPPQTITAFEMSYYDKRSRFAMLCCH